MDAALPEVEALLACDGRVIHTGATSEVRPMLEHARALGTVQVLDLEGRRAVPGFTDSHIHFLSTGLNLDRVELTDIKRFDEVLRRVRQAVLGLPAGMWLQGWGWDHSQWEEPRFPDRHSLDAATGDVPAVLRRKDGHMIWTNGAALRAAGVTRDTPDSAGGRVGRDVDSEPNGLFFEEAQDLVYRAVPPLSPDQVQRAAMRAMQRLHSLGVTGVHIPEGPQTLRALQALDAAGELRLRATMMLTLDGLDAAIETGLTTGLGGDRLRVGPVKIFSDGSLGSETAAMLEPFEASESNRGILTLPERAIQDAIERAARAGIGSAVHAIGDRANRVVLDAFAATRRTWASAGLRPRIEHVQVLHPDDLPRLAQIGVIASMQPLHATQDMDLVDRLWGARGRYAYAFRSLLDSGAHLAFGSDSPVEVPDPLAGLYAAVARRRPDGRPTGGWYPQERLTVLEALHAYTVGAAYAAGLEQHAGRLAPGRYCDVAVLSEDVLDGPPERILEARVSLTIFDGDIVFDER